MSKVNEQVEVDRKKMVWQFIRRLSVEYAAEMW